MQTDLQGDQRQFDTLTPIRRAVSVIFYIPLSWRKLLLDACRIQRPILQNQHLSDSFHNIKIYGACVAIPRRGQSSTSERTVDFYLSDLAQLFDHIYDNPFLCCILSYFVRAESTYFRSEFLSLLDESAIKEISASQQGDVTMQLNYRPLFTQDESEGIHLEIDRFPKKTVLMWQHHLASAIEHFSRRDVVLLPYFNPRKNIGYVTQRNLHMLMHNEVPYQQPTDYTTLDLLKFYAETGQRVPGPLEIRQAWKFNDLKPRTYYCLGGDSYFEGMYIKAFANYLVRAFPSTHPFSRFDVHRMGAIDSDHIFITYDYTSFTTSLAELKHFLWYLSTGFDQVEVQVLDCHKGLVSTNLGEMIRDYNEAVNQNQEYDVSRVLANLRGDGNDCLNQTRSGSLGVQGNIVFSTLNHGISLSGLTDTPDEDSCVGDDAALRLHLSLLLIFGTIACKLGLINPEKVTQIRSPDLEDTSATTRDSYKYLKRPIAVNWGGELITGFLDFFPNFAPIYYPKGDGIHTVSVEEEHTAIESFCMQWGRFLSTMYRTSFLDSMVEDDIEFILRIIRSVYRRCRLPFEGSIPSVGHYLTDDPLNPGHQIERVIDFYVPSCEGPEVFDTPWLDVLLARFDRTRFITPVRVREPVPIPDWVFPGCEFIATLSPFTRLLEGLGHIRSETIREEREFNEQFVNEFRNFLTGKDKETTFHGLYTFTVDTLPHWYHDYVINTTPVHTIGRRYGDATEEIRTLFGDSLS